MFSYSKFVENCMQINVSDVVYMLGREIQNKRKIDGLTKLIKSELKKEIWEHHCDTNVIMKYKDKFVRVPVSLCFSHTNYNGVRFYLNCGGCNAYVRKLYSPDFTTKPFMCRNCYKLRYMLQHYSKSRKSLHTAIYRSNKKKIDNMYFSLGLDGKRKSSKRLSRLSNLLSLTTSYQSVFLRQVQQINAHT